MDYCQAAKSETGAEQGKRQSFASLAFVRWIHPSPVESPHIGPVTRKIFPFDDVIMIDWECISYVEASELSDKST